MNTKQKGQAIVETAIMLPIILVLILGAIDPFLFGMNNAMAKVYTYQGAHEATIWIAGDNQTCYERSHAILSDGVDPGLVQVSSWTFAIYPCPNDPYWTTPTGSEVLSTFEFDFTPFFWPTADWHGGVSTRGIFQ